MKVWTKRQVSGKDGQVNSFLLIRVDFFSVNNDVPSMNLPNMVHFFAYTFLVSNIWDYQSCVSFLELFRSFFKKNPKFRNPEPTEFKGIRPGSC